MTFSLLKNKLKEGEQDYVFGVEVSSFSLWNAHTATIPTLVQAFAVTIHQAGKGETNHESKSAKESPCSTLNPLGAPLKGGFFHPCQPFKVSGQQQSP